MTGIDGLAGLKAATAGLFPAGVAVAVVRIGDVHPPPHAAEEMAVAMAVPSRRAEFAAGRTAARMALAAFGLGSATIPAGPDRAPRWPAGMQGSISHGAGFAVAAVHDGAPLGVDVEAEATVAADLWPYICTDEELDALPQTGRGQAVARVFSAKEAVFKAQYPLTRVLIGFDALSVRLTEGGFAARFRQTVGPIAAGHEMTGRNAWLDGVIVSGVTA